MMEVELARESIEANLVHLHQHRWAIEAGRLRTIIENASSDEKTAAERALQDHYDIRDQPETSRETLMQNVVDQINRSQRE